VGRGGNRISYVLPVVLALLPVFFRSASAYPPTNARSRFSRAMALRRPVGRNRSGFRFAVRQAGGSRLQEPFNLPRSERASPSSCISLRKKGPFSLGRMERHQRYLIRHRGGRYRRGPAKQSKDDPTKKPIHRARRGQPPSTASSRLTTRARRGQAREDSSLVDLPKGPSQPSYVPSYRAGSGKCRRFYSDSPRA